MLDGSTAYVADHNGGLIAIDLQDPQAPLAYPPLGLGAGRWADVEKVGGITIGAVTTGFFGQYGVAFADVRNPSAITVAGSISGASGLGLGIAAARSSPT